MSYDMLCTDAATMPRICTAFASMLASGVHNFITEDEWQFYISYRSSGYSLYEKSDGSYFRVDTKPNDILILPPHTHHIDYIDRTKAEDDGFLIAAKCEPDVLPVQFTKTEANTRTISLFGKFRSEWDKRLPGYPLRCTILFYQILEELAAQSRSQYMDSSKYSLIEPAVLYIHEHYQTGGISVATLATLCGITPQYFHHLFSGCMGATPAKYIENLRLQRAKELLETGKYSVSGVLAMCGYENASNFTRSFHRLFGVTPSSLLPQKKADLPQG